MDLTLITFSNNLCTTGNLYNGNDLICHTFELPWLDNTKNVSCIPAGEYKIKPVISPHFGNAYKIFDVTGRTQILIHKGNTTKDTEGCILPCDSFGVLGGELAGLSSKRAYDKLMNELNSEVHTLTIKRY